MKVVFFGTPQIAALIYTDLVKQGVDIVAVVTRPDKPQGRSGKLIPPPVKQVAKCPVLQPEKASTPEFEAELKKFNADLFIVVAYGEIMRQNILDIPKLGCVNIHASLLPKYRGASPIQAVLLAGETETGITIIEMSAKMDAGDVIEMARLPIPESMNAEELTEALTLLAQRTMLKVVKDFERGDVTRTPQDHSKATFVKKISREDCKIDWARSADAIHNQIRAFSPRPGAYTEFEGKGLKILKARSVAGEGEPGETLSFLPDRWVISAGQGAVELLEVQLEGKKKMAAGDFVRGRLK